MQSLRRSDSLQRSAAECDFEVLTHDDDDDVLRTSSACKLEPTDAMARTTLQIKQDEQASATPLLHSSATLQLEKEEEKASVGALQSDAASLQESELASAAATPLHSSSSASAAPQLEEEEEKAASPISTPQSDAAAIQEEEEQEQKEKETSAVESPKRQSSPASMQEGEEEENEQANAAESYSSSASEASSMPAKPPSSPAAEPVVATKEQKQKVQTVLFRWHAATGALLSSSSTSAVEKIHTNTKLDSQETASSLHIAAMALARWSIYKSAGRHENVSAHTHTCYRLVRPAGSTELARQSWLDRAGSTEHDCCSHIIC